MIRARLFIAALALCPLGGPQAQAVGGALPTVKSCEVLKQDCLDRVAAATQNAKQHGAASDAVWSGPNVCYADYDAAKSTGQWPERGPYLARHCQN